MFNLVFYSITLKQQAKVIKLLHKMQVYLHEHMTWKWQCEFDDDEDGWMDDSWITTNWLVEC